MNETRKREVKKKPVESFEHFCCTNVQRPIEMKKKREEKKNTVGTFCLCFVIFSSLTFERWRLGATTFPPTKKRRTRVFPEVARHRHLLLRRLPRCSNCYAGHKYGGTRDARRIWTRITWKGPGAARRLSTTTTPRQRTSPWSRTITCRTRSRATGSTTRTARWRTTSSASHSSSPGATAAHHPTTRIPRTRGRRPPTGPRRPPAVTSTKTSQSIRPRPTTFRTANSSRPPPVALISVWRHSLRTTHPYQVSPLTILRFEACTHRPIDQ